MQTVTAACEPPENTSAIEVKTAQNGQKGRCSMELLKRIRINLVVIWVIVGVLASALSAAPPSERCLLIKVNVAGRDDVQKLANMGLDIWEYHEGGLIIRVTENERRHIKESGFNAEIITEDVYEYTEKIRQEQISLFDEPTSAKYHSHDEVITALIELENSGVAKTYIIGGTHEGRDIWAVKISDNPSEDEEEPGAVFLGCHHAREWISVEVPLYIAQYLVANYDIDADIKWLVDNCEIWIVPVVNPDGYEYSRTTDSMWRKNKRDNGDGTFGVDLNRNYSYMWGGPDASPSTSSITYRGPYAFSEPETQAIRDLALDNDFRVLMSYHNYGQQILIPWGYTRDPCPDDIPISTMTFVMKEMIKRTTGAIYADWWDPPEPFLPGYLVGGNTRDWSYGELGIYSFCIELPPISGGFSLPVSRIMPTCVENLPVALYLISYVATDYGIENLTTGKTYNSIQLAINDANDGDELVLGSGVYHENISLSDKNLTLRSTDPNDPAVMASTVIHIVDSYQGSVVTLSGPRNGVCELAGLTITGGQVGISCCDASPTIRRCTVASNGPNAIEFWEDCEPPAIIDCTILGQVVEVEDPTFLANWTLDESDGSIAEDSAGDHDGVLFGEPVWQPEGGMVAGALQFDGIDDYVSTDPVLNPAEGRLSMFAWIKGGSPDQVVLSQANGVNWLSIDPEEGYLMTKLKNPGRGSAPLLSQTKITDGDWHRIGFVWDGLYRHLYVDGIEVAKDAEPLSGLESAAGGLYFGAGKALESGTFFSGLIDDIRIYNRVVSP